MHAPHRHSHARSPRLALPDHARVQLSDGECFANGLLPSTTAELIASGSVVVNQLVKLTHFIVNAFGANGAKACIVMGMEPVALAEGVETPEKIGEPLKWDSQEANEAYAAAAAQAEVATSSSPKQGPASGVTTPQTGNASSRVNETSRFAPGANGRPASSSQPMAPLSASRATPIESLNPYSNRWVIKARVNAKSELRTYQSQRGEGSVFSLDLADESAEIRATAWREVADRLYNSVEVGQTYLLSRGQLKMANKKFATLNNDYEITLTYDTQIQLCEEAAAAKPKTHYRFVSVADIGSRPKDALVDVLGVVTDVSAATSLTTKAGKELTKRTLKIADDSKRSIEVTLWGAVASAFPDMDASATEVVAFKGLRVTEWNEKSLGAVSSTAFEVRPAGQEEAIERLQSWWEGGGSGALESLSNNTRGEGTARDESSRTTTAEFAEKSDGMGAGSEPIYANMRAYLSKTLSGPTGQGEERFLWYASCPKCSKKVVGDETSGHNCESCGWSGAQCAYRYICPLMMVDADGTSIMTAFNDQATTILGAKADDLKALKDESSSRYDGMLAKAQWKPYVLRVRGKMETYQGNSRLKCHVLRVSPINYAEEAKNLLAEIAKYDA